MATTKKLTIIAKLEKMMKQQQDETRMMPMRLSFCASLFRQKRPSRLISWPAVTRLRYASARSVRLPSSQHKAVVSVGVEVGAAGEEVAVVVAGVSVA